MTKLKASLPDALVNLFDNVIVVFTRCIDSSLCQYDLDNLPFQVGDDNCFYIKNAAFSVDVMRASELVQTVLVSEWKMCMLEFHRLLRRISSLDDPPSIEGAMKSIRENRNLLRQILHEVTLKIDNLQSAFQNLEDIEAKLTNSAADKDRYKDFVQKKTIKELRLVDAPYHSTICQTCNSVCHDHCGLDELTGVGSNQFTGCSAFRGDNCVQCAKKCSYMSHYHARKTMQMVETTLDEVLHDVKQKYETSVNAINQATTQRTGILGAKDSINAAIDQEVAKLEQSCRTIIQHCSSFNLAVELSQTVDI